MEQITLGQIFLSEAAGTAILILLGVGVVANVLLAETKGNSGGTLMINFGWGLAVFAGVYTAFLTGAHINPAVTVGLWAADQPFVAETDTHAAVEANLGTALVFMAGQLVGAIIGAVLAWLAYRQHYDRPLDPALKLGTFATGPAIRNYGWNLVTEIIATFVLVFIVVMFGHTPSGLGPLAVAFLVVGIGASLGGPTGYAINPARDLGPRIAHALLPIKGKGGSDWGYSWVPIVGPLIGGALGGLAARVLV